VLDEIDEHGLCPLQVVDHDHLGLLGGTGFQEPPKGELRLGRGSADDGVGLDPDRDEQLDERPVRNPLAVRKATATSDQGTIRDVLDELTDEARLPNTGHSDDGEQLARSVTERLFERVVEAPPLTLSADHGRIETLSGVELERAYSEEVSMVADHFDVRRIADEP
jgi:hypothetical protein